MALDIKRYAKMAETALNVNETRDGSTSSYKNVCKLQETLKSKTGGIIADCSDMIEKIVHDNEWDFNFFKKYILSFDWQEFVAHADLYTTPDLSSRKMLCIWLWSYCTEEMLVYENDTEDERRWRLGKREEFTRRNIKGKIYPTRKDYKNTRPENERYGTFGTYWEYDTMKGHFEFSLCERIQKYAMEQENKYLDIDGLTQTFQILALYAALEIEKGYIQDDDLHDIENTKISTSPKDNVENMSQDGTSEIRSDIHSEEQRAAEKQLLNYFFLGNANELEKFKNDCKGIKPIKVFRNYKKLMDTHKAREFEKGDRMKLYECLINIGLIDRSVSLKRFWKFG